jgi:hypothetical protein
MTLMAILNFPYKVKPLKMNETPLLLYSLYVGVVLDLHLIEKHG